MQRVKALGPQRQWDDISVVLTDDDGIRPVNRDYLGSPEVTDVISFCYEPMPGQGTGHGAEIIVNVQRAEERGTRASRELALYIAHGCDHLTGATDDDDAGRARMRRRELRWLHRPENTDLIDSLLPARS
jgi:rRNA maturation RNase YbeY